MTQCKRCGADFDHPVYITPREAIIEGDELGDYARNDSGKILVPACPYCFRFTGWSKSC